MENLCVCACALMFYSAAIMFYRAICCFAADRKLCLLASEVVEV